MYTGYYRKIGETAWTQHVTAPTEHEVSVALDKEFPEGHQFSINPADSKPVQAGPEQPQEKTTP